MVNVINFSDIPGAQQYSNKINTTPETVLEYAKGKLSDVLVIGFNKEDESIYIASSNDDMCKLNFLIDMAKNKLFAMV